MGWFRSSPQSQFRLGSAAVHVVIRQRDRRCDRPRQTAGKLTRGIGGRGRGGSEGEGWGGGAVRFGGGGGATGL